MTSLGRTALVLAAAAVGVFAVRRARSDDADRRLSGVRERIAEAAQRARTRAAGAVEDLPRLADARTPAPAPPAAPELPAPVSADPDRGRFLVGAWPGGEPRVTLDLERVRARDALKQIAEQAGWTIVFRERARQKVDLTVNQLPADEAALLVLRETEGVVADRSGTVVTIRARRDEEASAEDADDEDAEAEAGDSSEDRVAMGGSVVVEPGESVRDAVAMGGSVTVKGTVRRDAVAMGGGVDVIGRVGRDADAMGGSVHVGPTGEVGRNASAMGGEVKVDPGGRLGGSRSGVGAGALMKGLMGVAPWRQRGPGLATRRLYGVARTLLWFVVGFVVSLVVTTLVPSRTRVVGREMLTHPVASGLVGILSAIALVPLTVALVVTVVGPLVLWFMVFAAMCLGGTALAQELGDRLPVLGARKTPVLALAIGCGALAVASLMPVLGAVLFALLLPVCLGAVVRTRFGTPPAGTPVTVT